MRSPLLGRLDRDVADDQEERRMQDRMTRPVTELDPRFSDRDAVATPWAEVEAALEGAELFWIATVRRDGRPHVTPLVGVWLDGALCFCTGPAEQKAVNLAANRNVALTAGCGTWDRGLDVVVEGEALPVTDAGELERLAAAWRTKWDGRWRFEPRDGGFAHDEGGRADVYRVAPSKVLAFAKGSPFGATRHVFR